jgi:hypothetical protein
VIEHGTVPSSHRRSRLLDLRGGAQSELSEYRFASVSIVLVLKSISLTWPGRAALSLAALVVGWAPFAVATFLRQSNAPDHGMDVAVVVLIFVILAWFGTMLPISLLVRPHSVVCRASIAPLFGGLCGLIALVVEIAVLTRSMVTDELWIYAWALWIGASAWSLYAWLLRHSFRAMPA